MKTYTMDGEPMSVREFREANAHDEECAGWLEQIEALEPGEELRLGGGAQPETIIRCVSELDDGPSIHDVQVDASAFDNTDPE